MNDFQLGRLLRLRRMRREWRLADVARRAGLSIATVARGEHGSFASVKVARQHAAALDVRLEWLTIGRGADVARTLDDEHAAIVEVVAAWLRGRSLEVIPEGSFSIYGERGRIDLLAYDAATRTVYLVEVKTELADVQDLLGTMDVRERLGPRIAADRGWAPAHVVSVLALADTSHNRAILRAHTATFVGWRRSTFRDDPPPPPPAATASRQILWVPAAHAGRSVWLAGRRRVPGRG